MVAVVIKFGNSQIVIENALHSWNVLTFQQTLYGYAVYSCSTHSNSFLGYTPRRKTFWAIEAMGQLCYMYKVED